MSAQPYKAVERAGYWLCTDMRTGDPASFPTTKSNARAEARLMNRCYNDAMQETVR